MRFYKIALDTTPDEVDNIKPAIYTTSIADAVGIARKQWAQALWPSVYIDLVEFKPDHKAVNSILNGHTPEMALLASFTLTQRGGLVKASDSLTTP